MLKRSSVLFLKLIHSQIKVFIIYYIKQYNGKRVGFCTILCLIYRNCRARVVPENILKKQARDQKLAQAVKDRRAKAKADRAAARKTALANAERYFNEYRAADQALVDSRRAAKKEGNFFVEAQPKVAFVIRIRG